MRNFQFDEDKARALLADAKASIASSILSPATESKKFQPLVESLKSLLTPRFGEVSVHFHGSCVVGVADTESELDILIEVGGKISSKFEILPKSRERLDAIEDALKTSQDWKLQTKSSTSKVQAKFIQLKHMCKWKNN